MIAMDTNLRLAMALVLQALRQTTQTEVVSRPERQPLLDLEGAVTGLLDRTKDPAFHSARLYRAAGWSARKTMNSPLVCVLLSGPTGQEYELLETDRSDGLAEPKRRHCDGDLPCDSPLLRWRVLFHLCDLTDG